MITALPMSKVVRSIACLLFPAILVFGMYIILHAHPVAPGGGFQGGSVIASALALVTVAFKGWLLKNDGLTVALFLGLILFLSIGLLGILDEAFLHNSLLKPLAKTGNILFLNIAVGLSVTGSLGLLLASFSGAQKKAGDTI